MFLRYDYGIKARGDSLEYKNWYSALKQLTDDVYPFWYDSYLKNKKDELQRDVIDFVDGIGPDIVFFILMRDEFSFETLDYLRSKYVTVNWFCDDQWRFDSFTRFYAPHFSFSATTDKYAINRYREIGCKNVIFVPPASFHCEKNINFQDIDYKYNVSFVGSFNRYREWFIKKLMKKGIKIECFGTGWSNKRVSFEEMAEIFKISKINLNISNSVSFDARFIFSNIRNFYFFMKQGLNSGRFSEQIKGRNFEIPSCGGFQLTYYVPSLEDFFVIGREVALYSSINDLVSKINYFLNDADGIEERKKIMINGYRRALKDGFTFIHRLKDMFKKMGIKL